ncbi:pyridine nucleotide-disulfide oxidoreductase [delta proteobacterium NaphS2]|nr:pyridine nucleotide-disulfide oxidoreductase [delta proteobacterium NaphS2]
MTDYVIVGNGAAGTHAAEAIRKEDGGGRITLVTDEDLPFYYRIRLNELISGDVAEADLLAKKEAWYRDQNIDLRTSTRVDGGDAKKKTLVTADGQELGYDRLLLATGSHSFVPPIKGSEKKGVFALRSVQDARDIASWAKKAETVVLIGGGLLGLETGNGLRKAGKQVTVVEFFPRLLPRQLDVDGAGRLQQIMEEMGFSFRLGAKTEEIRGEDAVTAVLLEGGEKLSADMVVISAGVRPNMELAEPLGLNHDKGIQVNERLETNQPHIYAAGDAAEFRGMPYGIWPAAMEQGKIAGTNMAGGDLTYGGTTMANTLKVVGVDLASAGNIDVENELDSRTLSDEEIYKKIVLENGRIVGCIMLGDTKGFNQVTKAMSEKTDVSAVKDEILREGFDFKSL